MKCLRDSYIFEPQRENVRRSDLQIRAACGVFMEITLLVT